MTALVAIPAACALLALLGSGAAFAFRHTHPAGQTCGWAGCQAKETP